MDKYHRLSIITLLIVLIAAPGLGVGNEQGVEEEKEKPMVKLYKIKKIRKKEMKTDILSDKQIKIDNARFYLKYKIEGWEAEEASLSIYVMRKIVRNNKEEITTYKNEQSITGEPLNKGRHAIELIQEYDDGTYSSGKYGPIVKIRVELWYPAYGGTLLGFLEEPPPDDEEEEKKGQEDSAVEGEEEEKLTWWERIDYGEYY